MNFNNTDKWVLLMRHAAFLWGSGGRKRLVTIALNVVGRHHTMKITSAPEKEAEIKTAEPVLDMLVSGDELRSVGGLEEIAIVNALAERSDASLDDLARTFKERADFEIVITHFARLEPGLAALRRVFAKELLVPDEKIRHRNKAYLVNLTTGTVYVIKEKS
jgi:hypothetical protein